MSAMKPALAAVCAAAALTGLGAANAADAPPPPQLVAPGATPATAPAAARAPSDVPADAKGEAARPAPQAAAPAASGVTTTEPRTPGEPEVKHIVVQDDHTRIEELRVRGVPQRIVVTSKVGGKDTSYEIITGDGSRDLSYGANTSRGATGKRVWRVLDF